MGKAGILRLASSKVVLIFHGKFVSNDTFTPGTIYKLVIQIKLR